MNILMQHSMKVFRLMALFMSIGTSLSAAEIPKPNLIVILTDDQGFGDLGCQPRNLEISTPQIDRLAKGGVRMTDGYAACPVCSGSRASLLAGRYGGRFGYYDNWESQVGIPTSVKLAPAYLKPLGYTSGIIGKWHLGNEPRCHPLEKGFDSFFGITDGQHDYFDADCGNSWSFGPHDTCHTWNNRERVDDVRYLTDEFSARAVEFVRKNKDHPFFLYLAYTVPHAPLQARKEDLAKYADDTTITPQRKIERAMLDALDRGVGELLACLDELGIADNTLIIFCSDNGGLTTAAGADNWILKGSKGYLSEGGIRVPFLARWPGHIPEDSVYRRPIQHIDIVPTLIAAAGGQVPEEMDGVNLLPFWRGEKTGDPHEALFWRVSPKARWAVRAGDWKLVDEVNGKFLHKGLFNLAEDISETKDLTSENPEIVARLKALENDWNSKNAPSLVNPETRRVHMSELRWFSEMRGPTSGRQKNLNVRPSSRAGKNDLPKEK